MQDEMLLGSALMRKSKPVNFNALSRYDPTSNRKEVHQEALFADGKRWSLNSPTPLPRSFPSPEAQCNAQGNYNVGFELQEETLAGRFLIGKSRLSASEEEAIAVLAAEIGKLPKDAKSFADGHETNVKNMRHPAWVPLRAKAAELLELLSPRHVRIGIAGK
jgi:hypothetical protein